VPTSARVPGSGTGGASCLVGSRSGKVPSNSMLWTSPFNDVACATVMVPSNVPAVSFAYGARTDAANSPERY